MSNAYNITTNFGAKDSLASGNPAKLILGAQFTTEFTNLFNALAALSVASPPTWQQPTGVLFNITDGTDQLQVKNGAGNISFGASSNSTLSIMTNGTTRFALSAAGGLFSQGVSGGDKGVGTINAVGLFIGGTAVLTSAVTSVVGTSNQVSVAGSTAVTLSLANNTLIPTPSSSSTGFGNYSLNVAAPTGAGVSFGLYLKGGTTAADKALLVNNAGDTQSYFTVLGDGSVIVGQPTAGASGGLGSLNCSNLYINGVLLALSTGSYTGTATGGTTSPTPTVHFTKVGTSVILRIASVSFVSNASTYTITGAPAGIRPTTANEVAAIVTNNGNTQMAGAIMDNTGVLTFSTGTAGTISTSGFTASGTKGNPELTVVYDLN
jgi:hypothetical protein